MLARQWAEQNVGEWNCFKSDQTGSGLSTLAPRPGRCEIFNCHWSGNLNCFWRTICWNSIDIHSHKKYYYIFIPAYPNKIWTNAILSLPFVTPFMTVTGIMTAYINTFHVTHTNNVHTEWGRCRRNSNITCKFVKWFSEYRQISSLAIFQAELKKTFPYFTEGTEKTTQTIRLVSLLRRVSNSIAYNQQSFGITLYILKWQLKLFSKFSDPMKISATGNVFREI